MIITKTPYRISFFGGGTDYPWWHNSYGEGNVISTTINKYSYINIKHLPKIFNYKYRIRYYLREEISDIQKIKHPVIRNLLLKFKINDRLDIVHSGDLPARTGIGSSSAFTVGFINSINVLKNRILDKKSLAKEAINFEQNVLKENVGSQDQISCTYGGFNYIQFIKKEFYVKNIKISNSNLINLQDSIVLFYLGLGRNSDAILIDMKKNIEGQNRNNEKYLKEMLNITKIAKVNLENKKFNLLQFGELLNYQWELKKNLSKYISKKQIDEFHSYLLNKGALGGKLLGAGGGGFYLSIIPKSIQSKILSKIKYKNIQIKFENTGSKLIFKNLNDQ